MRFGTSRSRISSSIVWSPMWRRRTVPTPLSGGLLTSSTFTPSQRPMVALSSRAAKTRSAGTLNACVTRIGRLMAAHPFTERAARDGASTPTRLFERIAGLARASGELRGAEEVLAEGRDRHRTDAPRHRRDERRDGPHGLEVDVAVHLPGLVKS